MGDSVKLRVELEDIAAQSLTYLIDLSDVPASLSTPRPPPRPNFKNIPLPSLSSSNILSSSTSNNNAQTVKVMPSPLSSERSPRKNKCSLLDSIIIQTQQDGSNFQEGSLLRKSSPHSPISVPIDYYVSDAYKAMVLDIP